MLWEKINVGLCLFELLHWRVIYCTGQIHHQRHLAELGGLQALGLGRLLGWSFAASARNETLRLPKLTSSLPHTEIPIAEVARSSGHFAYLTESVYHTCSLPRGLQSRPTAVQKQLCKYSISAFLSQLVEFAYRSAFSPVHTGVGFLFCGLFKVRLFSGPYSNLNWEGKFFLPQAS